MDADKSATILIVDDEPDNLQEIEDVFHHSRRNYKILKSPNGKKA